MTKKILTVLLFGALEITTSFVVRPSTSLVRTASLQKLSVSVSEDSSTKTSSGGFEGEPLGKPGTADIEWSKLGFEFHDTKSHLQMTYRDGEWSEPELLESPYINIHTGATALHYGQSCFEGLKAFAHEDGSVNIFRPDQNAKRMQKSGDRTMMPAPSEEQFLDACNRVVRDNIAYVPPYGSGGALYLRPLLFGSGPRIGLQPADEYTFLILVIPVGNYYKGDLKPVDGVLITDYDRAAPRGVGNVKVAGNYAADLLPNQNAKKKGFPIGLYVDAATQSYVEEFSTSNFVGIQSKEKKFVTPKSESVLKSITNKSLMTLAEDEGWTVEKRDIPLKELETFDEVLAVGTAVVLTPVDSITKFDGENEKKYSFGEAGTVGDFTKHLYDRIRAIQNGDEEDKYGWNRKVY